MFSLFSWHTYGDSSEVVLAQLACIVLGELSLSCHVPDLVFILSFVIR